MGVGGGGDGEVSLVTDCQWRAERDGWSQPVAGLAELPYDPRWVQLRPRRHSLPHGGRLEGLPDDPTVLGVPTALPDPGSGAADQRLDAVDTSGPRRTEWFRFRLPPGTVALRLPLLGAAAAFVYGEGLVVEGGEHRLRAPAAGGTWCTVRADPSDGPSGGGLWTGPVEVVVGGAGVMPLGDWQHLGLVDWAGGVGYRTTVERRPAACVLDLGVVRGAAEVRVNGRSAGCRPWSPYRFDVRGLFEEAVNVVEVDVFGTLAPHVAAVSTTPWVLPGQRRAGLLGPVTLSTG